MQAGTFLMTYIIRFWEVCAPLVLNADIAGQVIVGDKLKKAIGHLRRWFLYQFRRVPLGRHEWEVQFAAESCGSLPSRECAARLPSRECCTPGCLPPPPGGGRRRQAGPSLCIT